MRAVLYYKASIRFPTSSNARHNTNELPIFKGNQLIHVFFPLNHYGHTIFLDSYSWYIPKSY